MLKSCYFTPRQEILDWINQTLQTKVSRIEQLGAGNLYCQLLDAAYPGKVPLHKIKWNALLELDFLFNYKILQSCFERLGIERFIDVQKLAKAKYQDNLEFSQWLKGHLSDRITLNKHYNALERRRFASINLEVGSQLSHVKSSSQFNFNNKENQSEFNYLLTPRKSLKSARGSLGSIQTLTPRNTTTKDDFGQSKTKTFLNVTSKNIAKDTKESKYVHTGRVRTEMGPLISNDITKELILQADEEQYF